MPPYSDGNVILPNFERIAKVLSEQPAAVPFPSIAVALTGDGKERRILWNVSYSAAPTTLRAALQGALVNKDVEFFDLDTSINPSGETRSLIVNVPFVRINIGALSPLTLTTGRIFQ